MFSRWNSKKVWNPKDPDLYIHNSERFTSRGYKNYWEAIDHTVRYFDSVIIRKTDKKVQQNKASCKLHNFQSGQKDQGQKDPHRFHWQNPRYNMNSGDAPSFRRLPDPPPKR